MIDIQRRNKVIRQRYYELLEQGNPVMLAYAMVLRVLALAGRAVLSAPEGAVLEVEGFHALRACFSAMLFQWF